MTRVFEPDDVALVEAHLEQNSELKTICDEFRYERGWSLVSSAHYVKAIVEHLKDKGNQQAVQRWETLQHLFVRS